MEITYFSASVIFIAAFAVFAILAFRTARRAKMEGGGEAGRSEARPGSLCSECLGATNLDARRMAECSSACALPPA
jgi:hypothetical protein